MEVPSQEALAGGNMEPVIRIGNTVRRAAGPWTVAVHRLLDRYQATGIVETPRALGLDEKGREVLSYLPGEMLASLPPAERWNPALLREAGELLRRLHDASQPMTGSADRWRQPAHPPIEVVCHNDFAPYNLIVDHGRLTGVIDFDMASPGSRLWDLAYLAYRLVPFAEDAADFDPGRDGSREQRLADLVAAYGRQYTNEEVRKMAVRRLESLAVFTDRRAEETGRTELIDHAAMYRRDAARLGSNEHLQSGMEEVDRHRFR